MSGETERERERGGERKKERERNIVENIALRHKHRVIIAAH